MYETLEVRIFSDDRWYYFNQGMNAAVRAVVRMGLFVGCKVYLIKEVSVFCCSQYFVTSN